MSFTRHGRMRQRVSLLASGALSESEREAVEAHVVRCDRCRAELAELRQLVALVAQDPLRGQEPEIPLAALVTRVGAQLDAEPPRRRPWRLALASLAATAAAGLLAVLLLPGPESPAEGPQVAASEAFLDQLERNLAREQAARYLSEAQDVLVTVAATPSGSLCDREGEQTLDVTQEARRSRELLRRRALLVEMDGAEVASARPVLEDVEEVLREVASLPSCARARDLETIHQRISERRLLMKISLMTRELQG